jgi:hypothetical protein
MKLRAEKLTENEFSLWNDFVNKSPQGSFFNTTQWANLLADTFNRPYQIIVLKNDQEIVAGIIAFIHSKLMFRMVTPVPLFPYNGPVLADHTGLKYQKIISRDIEYINRLTDYFIKEFHFFTWQTSPLLNDVRAFQWKNCRAEPTYSYRLHVNDWNSCQAAFNQTVRKKVRQAERDNYKFKKSDAKSSFLNLYSQSYLRHNMQPLIKEEILDKFLDKILKLPQVHMYEIDKDSQCLAGRIIVQDGLNIYDLLAGSDDPQGNASAFLVYKILELFSQDEFVFDFLGADHPRIEEFKRGFGGKLLPGYQITGPVGFPISWIIKMKKQMNLRGRKL